MQVLGRSDAPWVINSEIGDLGGFLLTSEPLFTFQRYDARLDRDWLRDELGMKLSDEAVAGLARLDNSAAVPLAYEIGQAAAEKYVQPSHFGL